MEIIDYPNYKIYPDGKIVNKHGKELKQHIGIQNKYYYVDLYDNWKRKRFNIHRLLAIHYIPNPENKEYVDHKDRNRLNNNLNNLRWFSRTENNNNISISKNNKSGHKNIYYCNTYNKWFFTIDNHKCKIKKKFNTLDEAVNFKNEYLSNL